MGEYAERKSDREEIKIGTCESMYYLRYSDREKVRAKEGNVDPNDDSTIKELLWRLPFPDEDHIQPGGNYKEYNRGAALSYDFTNPDNADYPGILQLHSKTGLLVNIACYHGEKKPTDTKEVQFHWNGKAPSYNLTALKFRDDGVYGIYSCTECGHAWRRPLKEIIPFMISYEDQDLVKRLIEWYCPEIATKKESVPA